MNVDKVDRLLDKLSESLDEVEAIATFGSWFAVVNSLELLDELKTATGYYQRIRGE